MFSSIELGRIRGIPIRLHISLLIVFGLLVMQFGLLGVPAGVLLFGSVMLHELGHSVVAQKYGIRIASIDLHLLGGMALMSEQPRTAKQEIAIALAGPAVSFALGLTSLGLAILVGASFDFTMPRPVDLFAYAAGVNLAMGLFNLVPALPMDGGRVFRALLQSRLGNLRATRIAATVSRVFGGLFVVGGLAFGHFSLAMIGVLLFFMVRGEERAAEARAQHGPMTWAPGSGETRRIYVDPFGRRILVVTRWGG
jgi:Zn-dependent protease